MTCYVRNLTVETEPPRTTTSAYKNIGVAYIGLHSYMNRLLNNFDVHEIIPLVDKFPCVKSKD